MAFWNRKPEPKKFVEQIEDPLVDENEGLSNQQLLSALNAAKTALMMIDRDFQITYLNKQSLILLKQHEVLFQSVWPGFKAEESSLIGYCIDGFHVNPQHQRQCVEPSKFTIHHHD